MPHRSRILIQAGCSAREIQHFSELNFNKIKNVLSLATCRSVGFGPATFYFLHFSVAAPPAFFNSYIRANLKAFTFSCWEASPLPAAASCARVCNKSFRRFNGANVYII